MTLMRIKEIKANFKKGIENNMRYLEKICSMFGGKKCKNYKNVSILKILDPLINKANFIYNCFVQIKARKNVNNVHFNISSCFI